MSTIAFFSDIHANIDAFEAVLADATDLGVSEWYCLGDMVGYGSEGWEIDPLRLHHFMRVCGR